MDTGLKGKVAVVAAASRGLGFAAARALAGRGVRVVICARNQEGLAVAEERIRSETGTDVSAVAVDVAQPDAAKMVTDVAKRQFGGLDILVTNSGGPPAGPFLDLSEEQWRNAVDSLLMSNVRFLRESVPLMKERGGGSIVNIASISVKQPIPNLALSNSIRAAVVGLAKTLASELAPMKIRVNTVCPGAIATQRLQDLDRFRAENEGCSVEDIAATNQSSIPLGRYGKPEELASLIVFLASSWASYITGTTILCDGGAYSGLM